MKALAYLLDTFASAQRFLPTLGLVSLVLSGSAAVADRKALIIDTDIFSDVDDAAALLLAATDPSVSLLAVNVNYPSSYSALATSALLAHYGHPSIPIGLRRPITNDTFFDDWAYELGEYTSKVAYHWSGGSLPWFKPEDAWIPVELYRKVLSEQDDNSVTIASIGFLENLSILLNSTADKYSMLSGVELVQAKVAELVVMGGDYPSGYEFNFWSDNPLATAHVVNTWPGRITYLGSKVGEAVSSGAILTTKGPMNDPVKRAFEHYIGFNRSRYSWDPLTVVYACQGLGEWFEYGGSGGYNHVFPNGSNVWMEGAKGKGQQYLKLKMDNDTIARELDSMLLHGANLFDKS
ncbi:hypothetical protein COCCADRAFT_25361 [Bipolaris zeicola 26-R-13]|uniref:Inosine/uridine-preferring nucleoside hydrolase domain-containing protein n=1 Tax=Cochliobolus carbonum (strain 26-R-13) TaxID=930089 RepID=W6YG68_COCC2|nr:uncharacterized protein COCCADRAFT_25361 [Bipolaris zeicola 26-R-13]EUC34479.1 hypothetical protein COCCADRAFT_25361 [Bipolaris zeicola 26-R-13]